MVTVIIPAVNEASVIERTLDGLARAAGDFEVIVADGGSTDGTSDLVAARISEFPHPLAIVTAPRMRAIQLNRGAEIAAGDVLLFLHADIDVPADAIARMAEDLNRKQAIGGNFQIIFGGDDWASRFFTWVYRARRPFGIYYGDSGIIVKRKVFAEMGGFKLISIMDDYEFVRRLERRGKTICVDAPLMVSDRRWRVQGLFRTLFSWVWIQALYSLGVSPERLAARYSLVRERENTASSVFVGKSGVRKHSATASTTS